jgi:hypothetical protein
VKARVDIAIRARHESFHPEIAAGGVAAEHTHERG